MGYATSYRLTILDPDGKVIAAAETAEIWQQECDGRTLLDIAGPDGESCKWYEVDEDMQRIAAEFPAFVLQIDGKGEDAGDVWRNWYHGDKRASWRVDPTPPAYDPTRMK